jgi:hypothetical protein
MTKRLKWWTKKTKRSPTTLVGGQFILGWASANPRIHKFDCRLNWTIRGRVIRAPPTYSAYYSSPVYFSARTKLYNL